MLSKKWTVVTVSNIHDRFERTSAMTYFLILLAISILFCVFVLPYLLRSYARDLADHFLESIMPIDKKLIGRCISILTWTNKWITKQPDIDRDRIRALKILLGKAW